MKERRGVCTECGLTKAVTARGVMRMHWPPRYGDHRRFREYCSGTGMPPARYVEDPPLNAGIGDAP